MPSWVAKAVDDTLRKREDQRLASSLIQKSSNAAPVLFRMLADQLSADIAAFNDKTGKRIQCSVSDASVNIKHESFPIFTLELNQQDSDVVLRTNRRQTAMSQCEPDHVELLSFTAGINPQEFYYVYQGERFPRVEDIVGALMYPLIQFLNA